MGGSTSKVTRMKRLANLITSLTAVLALALPAAAQTSHVAMPITVDQLLGSTVVVAPGGILSDEDRARLEDAAIDLAKVDDNGESFPTRFVLVPEPESDLDLGAQAKALRTAGIAQIGDSEQLDAVFVITPSHKVGIAANAFLSEIKDAKAAEKQHRKSDPIGGLIAIAERLRVLDATNALPDGSFTEIDNSSNTARYALIAGGVLVLLVVIAAVIASRRSAARRAAREAEAETDRERAADDGAPPPELRQ